MADFLIKTGCVHGAILQFESLGRRQNCDVESDCNPYGGSQIIGSYFNTSLTCNGEDKSTRMKTLLRGRLKMTYTWTGDS
jgi:hypothetical protein